MARFTDMDMVGVLAFWLGFMFGSPSHLGWHSHLDGDFIMSADMGYVRGGLQGREQGWRMGAGWGIISGAIGHLLSVMGTYGHLLKEVPMAPWPFVMVGTCGCSSITSPNWDVSNSVACTFILDTVLRMGLIPFLGVCHCMYILAREWHRFG